MQVPHLADLWRSIFQKVTLCRGCLGAIDPNAEAGLCARCWEGLVPLSGDRCFRCALAHASDDPCPDPVAWSRGTALWDYHGGRPPLGSLLVPSIKMGEVGWKDALLRRLAKSELPEGLCTLDLVTPVPTVLPRRWLRGFDLAEEAAQVLASRLTLPFRHTLSKRFGSGSQARRTESERRRLPARSVQLRPGAEINGQCILLVDDVWTTGTTLLRCAQALERGGAREVQVLTLFRSLSGDP